MARRRAKSTDASAADSRQGPPKRGRASGSGDDSRTGSIGTETERAQLAERLEELADPLRDRLRRPMRRVNGWWRRLTGVRPYRVWIQFSHNDGNLRTAGMAYQSLFAVFAALWVGFSIAGIWLTSDRALFDRLVEFINDAVPGLIGANGRRGVIDEASLSALGSAFGWTSIVALVGLLWTAVAWLYYTRQAVRAMFELDHDERNYALQKVTDLGLAIVFGALLIVSASVSVVTTEALRSVFDWLGIGGTSFWFDVVARVIGFAISIALNYIVLVAMFRVLSRVAIPWRRLVVGPLLGAVALSGLSVLSGLLIGGATKNPLLATFAVFVGLLLWFNLICRVILLAAAWIAVGMLDRSIDPRRRTPEQVAYEKASAERSARLLVARTAVDDAERRAASARGMAKWLANRAVRDARRELARIASLPDPTPPMKRSWWAEGESEAAQAPPKHVGGRR